jgi:hypothetical protein
LWTRENDPLPFPEPPWLAGNVEALLAALSDEARRLYRGYLADEVRAPQRYGILVAWRAFDRAMCEIRRRNEGRRQP